MTDGPEPDDDTPPVAPLLSEAPDGDATDGPAVGVDEAARRLGLAPSTLRRRLAAGAVDGAYRGERGAWRIPLAALDGVDSPSPPPPPPRAPTPEPAPAGPPTLTPTEGMERLLHEVSSLRADVRRLQREWDEARSTLEEIRDRTLTVEAGSPAPAADPVEVVEMDGVEDETEREADGPTGDDLLPEPRKWWDRF